MKKYLIALLFGMSFMSMQPVSAATLRLDSDSSQPVTGASVTGTSTTGGNSVWTLSVADASTPVNVTFTFDGGGSPNSFLFGQSSFAFFNGNFSALLAAGSYFLAISPSLSEPYSFTAALDGAPVGDVPVPAAVWLFGSALPGLIGAAGRKSQPALAA